MSGSQNKLTAKKVENRKEPGMLGDGGGLWLIVEKSGAKRWMHIYQFEGKRREMGLGPLGLVSLAQARDLREANRKLLLDGRDPIVAREAARAAHAAERAAAEAAATVPFFEAYARVVGKRLVVKRESTRASFLRLTSRANVGELADKRVNEILTEDVRKLLEPIWATLPAKAQDLRQAIDRTLRSARAEGYMGSLDTPWQNPAQLVGHLDAILPKRRRRPVRHYPALPHEEVGAFMAALHARQGVSARLLEFEVLTLARGHEARHMRVKNLDLAPPAEAGAAGEHGLWRVPAGDQKSDLEYVLPLSAEARAVLDETLAMLGPDPDPEAVVFASRERGPRWRKELSHRAAREVVAQMGYAGRASPHGFRSTFRDWAGDKTDFAREVIEHCLSHAVGDAVELAYRRRDALEKRYRVLCAWGARCRDASQDTVVAFAPRKAAA